MNHQKNLRILFQTYLKSCGETFEQKKLFFSYLLGWVPEQAAPQVFKEQGLTFSGNEKRLLDESYGALRKDKRTEHLEERKLNEKFTNLLAEVLERKSDFKNPATLAKRIDEFLAEIVKPEGEYRVMFRIVNLETRVTESQFWDCLLATYDLEQLIAWGFDPKKKHPVGVESFENKTVIVVKAKGTNATEVVKRARVTATRRLRVLQNYLKEEMIHDEQLFFELSKEYAVRNEATGKIGWGFDNKNSAIPYDYSDFLVERVSAANDDFARIQKFPPNIRELIERTLHWIGLAISEIDPDIKVSFLSTALETLLTTKDDGRKGERIGYRGYLLAEEVSSEVYYTPQEVLAVYEKRNSVVHGSDISVASQKDYWLMLDFAQATLKNFIEYVDKHKLTRPTQVFAGLLESEKLDPLLRCLEEGFDDELSKDIAKALDEDLQKKKRSEG